MEGRSYSFADGSAPSDSLVYDTVVSCTFEVGLLQAWEVIWFQVIQVFVEAGIIDGVNIVVASRSGWGRGGLLLCCMLLII